MYVYYVGSHRWRKKLLNQFPPNLEHTYKLGQKDAQEGLLEHFENLSLFLLFDQNTAKYRFTYFYKIGSDIY